MMIRLAPISAFAAFAFAALFAVCAGPSAAQTNFDYDSKADFAVYRHSDGNWYSYSTETGESTTVRWGLPADSLVPGDYDGDGLTDIAVWRPEDGNWYILYKRDGATSAVNWGMRAMTPFGPVDDEAVQGDYDGDGCTDIAVWRPTTGVWSILLSTSGFSPNYARYFAWGMHGDVPVPADYDGDGRTDIAVFRSWENSWYISFSKSGSWKKIAFGNGGYDKLAPADYTGDEIADIAVYRNGNWIVRDSATGEIYHFAFGLPSDVPVPADYNGDGVTDLAVFRNGTWYIREVLGGRTWYMQYGLAGDSPLSSNPARRSITPIP